MHDRSRTGLGIWFIKTSSKGSLSFCLSTAPQAWRSDQILQYMPIVYSNAGRLLPDRVLVIIHSD